MQTRNHASLRSNVATAALAWAALILGLHVGQPAHATGSAGGIGGTGAISLASGPAAGPETCALATRVAEANHGLPAGLMAAISTVESGRYDPVLQANLAWPWTINAEGSGSHFDSKADAIAEVSALLDGGMESIDVGCMQVNLRWHPDAFASLDEAFDPATNADYAARLLLRLFAQHGDWPTAIGHYHSPTDWRQADYQAKVAAAWAGLGGGFAGLPVATAPTADPVAPTGPTLFGGLVASGGPIAGGGPMATGGSIPLAGTAGTDTPQSLVSGGGQVTVLTGPGAGTVHTATATAGAARTAAADGVRFFPLPAR
ncbi:MAG: lytic transglycosylase domain-containing protein [Alphaproteobacteria bacterium]